MDESKAVMEQATPLLRKWFFEKFGSMLDINDQEKIQISNIEKGTDGLWVVTIHAPRKGEVAECGFIFFTIEDRAVVITHTMINWVIPTASQNVEKDAFNPDNVLSGRYQDIAEWSNSLTALMNLMLHAEGIKVKPDSLDGIYRLMAYLQFLEHYYGEKLYDQTYNSR